MIPKSLVGLNMRKEEEIRGQRMAIIHTEFYNSVLDHYWLLDFFILPQLWLSIENNII